MNWIIDQKLKENESAEIKKAMTEWDHESQVDFLRRLELALEDRGQQVRLVGLARAHAPEAATRVGTVKRG